MFDVILVLKTTWHESDVLFWETSGVSQYLISDISINAQRSHVYLQSAGKRARRVEANSDKQQIERNSVEFILKSNLSFKLLFVYLTDSS